MKIPFIKSSSFYLALLVLAFSWYGCKKDDSTPPKTAPTGVSTSVATSITPTGATISGSVTTDGGAALTARGVVYSKTNATPTTDDDQAMASGTAVGSFSVVLTGLDGTTKYYARAFATNSVGITYGSVVEFTTATAATVPTVTTTEANTLTTNTAKSGGNVVDDGGAPVTEKGIYWGTAADPGPSNGTLILGGTGTGPFNLDITSLSPNTTYHVRAYAKNSVGTGWGADLTFKTQEIGKPQVSTKPLSGRTYTGVTSGGTISNQGGTGQTVTEWGLVYSTTDQTPTVGEVGCVKVVGTTPPFSNFNISITDLTSGTKVYLCAYATNSPGGQTGYGQILSYTPPPATIVYQGVTYNTVIIGSQVWFKENLAATKWQDNTTPILMPTSSANWQSASNSASPAFSFIKRNGGIFAGFSYSSTDVDGAGAYYNHYAVVDPRNLCPVGWKVPSSSDFEVLINELGGSAVAGDKLKSNDGNWWTTTGSNSSGFSAFGVGTIEASGEISNLGRKNGTDIYTKDVVNGSGVAIRINPTGPVAIPLGGGGPRGRGNPVRCLMNQ